MEPTYKYRPDPSDVTPNLRSKNQTRARAFAGGTFFRSRESGIPSNNISVEIAENKLIVTNHNTVFAENMMGPADIIILEQNLDWRERYTIDNLTTTPRARRYSISLQIAPALSAELGSYAFSTILHIPDKLSALVTPRASEVTASSIITFKARTRVYDLTTVYKTSEAGTAQGLDPDALRTAVNATDPWIEMPPRSGQSVNADGTLGTKPSTPYDVYDTAGDSMFLSAFPKTYLQGGDGLPAGPDLERTGPTRALVHVSSGESTNGKLVEVNKVYEWYGDSPRDGLWTPYVAT